MCERIHGNDTDLSPARLNPIPSHVASRGVHSALLAVNCLFNIPQNPRKRSPAWFTAHSPEPIRPPSLPVRRPRRGSFKNPPGSRECPRFRPAEAFFSPGNHLNAAPWRIPLGIISFCYVFFFLVFCRYLNVQRRLISTLNLYDTN